MLFFSYVQLMHLFPRVGCIIVTHCYLGDAISFQT